MDPATVRQLCKPHAFDHPAQDIVLHETHISWVILAGDYAYKIKKPVNFDFLDFSTLQRRHHFCQRELELNSRFAPELYLAVVPITRRERGPVFGGDGEAIDHAVKMRRFGDDQLLDAVADRGGLDKYLLRSLARELSRLHGELPVCRPPPESASAGTPEALHRALEQNFEQLGAYPLAEAEQLALAGISQWTRHQYDRLLPLLLQRLESGHVIDGHGDVHLGNIAIIEEQVRLFDCIEFNADFRIIDSMGEAALLSMDLEARQHPAESHIFLGDYLEYRGDYQGLEILDLYRAYYALVRAKVNLLKRSPQDPDLHASEAYREAQRYLQMALGYTRPRQPFLAITHGVSGSGKSTKANKIVAACGAIRIRSDVERKRLFGLQPEQRSEPSDEGRLYSREMTRATFERLEQLAAQILDSGFPVIVDATFLHRRVRSQFSDIAARHEVPFAIIDCVAEPETLRQRVIKRDQHRRDASEANLEVLKNQQQQREPLQDRELPYRVAATADMDAETLWRDLRRVLHRQSGGE